MTPYALNINKTVFRKIQKAISIVILAAFISTSVKSPAYAQPSGLSAMARLPAPGVMVHLSPEFTPAHLQGITIHPDNALQFDFLIHKGDQELAGDQKKEEYKKLIKYFLASLTIPDEDQWVNLSPYEKDRIIKDDFGKTEMGRDLLAQDYLLKQITSSLIYPEENLGKKFWDRVYERTYKEYGSTNIPVNTFNKVWIIPDEAAVYESGNTVYVLRNHLKVMLEQDYLSLDKHAGISQGNVNSVNKIGSQIVREIILPELEKEVNEGKNFANLRQIYSGMILATWYKHALKESLLGKVYANQAKVQGVTGIMSTDPGVIASEAKQSQEQIYQQYLKAFKKGVFNYIKEDADKYTNEVIPRKYFSGGAVDFEGVVSATSGFNDAMVVRIREGEPIPLAIAAKITLPNGSMDRATAQLLDVKFKPEEKFEPAIINQSGVSENTAMSIADEKGELRTVKEQVQSVLVGLKKNLAIYDLSEFNDPEVESQNGVINVINKVQSSGSLPEVIHVVARLRSVVDDQRKNKMKYGDMETSQALFKIWLNLFIRSIDAAMSAKPTIVVFEDDPDLVDPFGLIWQDGVDLKFGNGKVEVVVASTIEEAKKILSERNTVLVVSDTENKNGQHWIDFVQESTQNGLIKSPVFGSSGKEMKRQWQEKVGLPDSRYIQKPYALDEIFKAVDQVASEIQEKINLYEKEAGANKTMTARERSNQQFREVLQSLLSLPQVVEFLSANGYLKQTFNDIANNEKIPFFKRFTDIKSRITQDLSDFNDNGIQSKYEAALTDRVKSVFSGKELLIADDESAITLTLGMFAKRYGAKVTTVKDGLEAKALLEDPTKKFDGLISDVDMPGMDGEQLAQFMSTHPNLSKMPRIFWTGKYPYHEAFFAALKDKNMWLLDKGDAKTLFYTLADLIEDQPKNMAMTVEGLDGYNQRTWGDFINKDTATQDWSKAIVAVMRFFKNQEAVRPGVLSNSYQAVFSSLMAVVQSLKNSYPEKLSNLRNLGLALNNNPALGQAIAKESPVLLSAFGRLLVYPDPEQFLPNADAWVTERNSQVTANSAMTTQVSAAYIQSALSDLYVNTDLKFIGTEPVTNTQWRQIVDDTLTILASDDPEISSQIYRYTGYDPDEINQGILDSRAKDLNYNLIKSVAELVRDLRYKGEVVLNDGESWIHGSTILTRSKFNVTQNFLVSDVLYGDRGSNRDLFFKAINFLNVANLLAKHTDPHAVTFDETLSGRQGLNNIDLANAQRAWKGELPDKAMIVMRVFVTKGKAEILGDKISGFFKPRNVSIAVSYNEKISDDEGYRIKRFPSDDERIRLSINIRPNVSITLLLRELEDNYLKGNISDPDWAIWEGIALAPWSDSQEKPVNFDELQKSITKMSIEEFGKKKGQMLTQAGGFKAYDPQSQITRTAEQIIDSLFKRLNRDRKEGEGYSFINFDVNHVPDLNNPWTLMAISLLGKPSSSAGLPGGKEGFVETDQNWREPGTLQRIKDKGKIIKGAINKLTEKAGLGKFFDSAQLAVKGGIDFNSANLNLQIKRDGRGVPLPLAQQDMSQLMQIQGFEPEIIEIKPAVNLPILSELQQKLQPSAT